MELLAALVLLAQDAKPHPGVDQARVDRAIDRGAEFLLKQEFKPFAYHEHGNMRYDDLVLYTLYHAGVDREHAVFKALLKNILETPLERTYCVSLQAMFLSELDPVKYQWRIAQCCQFLVDNICDNGQWSYGEPTKIREDVPTFARPPEDVATEGGKQNGRKLDRPKPKTIIHVRPQRGGKPSGDNSNSQYAALGLRACMEANVFPAEELLQKAKKWWELAQNQDGGWGYGGAGSVSYGSMTIGAAGSLVIYKHFLRENWKSDKRVVEGLRWLVKNWTVAKNPGTNEGFVWHYYYLYAVERAGILTGMEKFAGIDWYKEGANFLLDAQKDDGSWYEGNTWGGSIKDTCFAILFLRRATVPLPKVASGGRK